MIAWYSRPFFIQGHCHVIAKEHKQRKRKKFTNEFSLLSYVRRIKSESLCSMKRKWKRNKVRWGKVFCYLFILFNRNLGHWPVTYFLLLKYVSRRWFYVYECLFKSWIVWRDVLRIIKWFVFGMIRGLYGVWNCASMSFKQLFFKE